MSRVLLTGGTGFLGSHIADALVAAGHDVLASVRATSDTRWIDPLGVETTTVDLGRADESAIGSALAGIDAVVHCAGLTRARSEAHFMAVNAGGTERLALAARDAGARRFVFISSLAARGPDGATGPQSPYGRSKAEGERRLVELADDLDVVILRPGGVYGPRDNDMLPLFGLARRGLLVVPRSTNELQPVYVSDVVTATLGALEAPAPGEPLPIAHRERRSWGELAAALAAAVGRDGRLIRVPPRLFWTVGLLSEVGALATRRPPAMDRRKADDLTIRRWTCDIAETERSLDWAPEVGLEEGLARTAAWYREEGWL
ncbi:MAG: NAD-dependent epimerase/dehydratase family protein [Gemmatimonadota bacterium]|nr:NAD-dependent epimerase/dehydratase family protein [Gemmatimonadota bacterium]